MRRLRPTAASNDVAMSQSSEEEIGGTHFTSRRLFCLLHQSQLPYRSKNYPLPFPSLLHELLVLRVHDLLRHFHKNAQGDLHCPVTFKVCDRGWVRWGAVRWPRSPRLHYCFIFPAVCLYLGGGIFHLPKTCCWDSRNNQPICGFLGLESEPIEWLPCTGFP